MRVPASPLAHRPGASAFANSAIGTTAVTVVSAASNVNGCWIRTVNVHPASGAVAAIFVGTSAPVNWTASGRIMMWSPTSAMQNPLPFFVPAGQAVYVIASTGTATSAVLSYDLL